MKILLIRLILISLTFTSLISKEIIITDQSTSQVVCKGSNIELWVDAQGKSLEYEWYFNDKPIIGAKSRILKIDNFDYSKTGNYFCILNSMESANSEKSDDIKIYIASETLFLKRPENVMYHQGGFAQFDTKVHANQDSNKYATLQWYFFDGDEPDKFDKLIKLKDNNKYSGSTSEFLTVKNLNNFDKGIYFCIAEGKCGNDTTFAFLNDKIYFKLKKISKDFDACAGEDVVLEVEVTSYVSGELEYQWFNPGFKEIKESKKFIGTKTKKLLIKNVQRSDNNAYYLKVTHKESGYFARSDHFYVEPDYPPVINTQPKDYLVKEREGNPTHYGQTYVGVFVENLKPCTFKWYRNDTLVRTTYGIGTSNYFLGPQYEGRPAVPSDVGVYQCEIINDCGTTWSKKARVIWGLDDVNYCENTDAILVADSISKDTNQYYYFWYYNNQIIVDNNKFKNSNSNKLTITNVSEKDRGSYSAYLQAKNGGLTYYLGKAFLQVSKAPEITKQLPDTLYLNGKWIKKSNLVIKVLSPVLYYQYFDDKDEAISEIMKRNIINIYEEFQSFPHGGYDFKLEDGTYYIKFWNDCGITKSNHFTISRTEKPSGIVLDSNFISSIKGGMKDSQLLYPNPSSDFIHITIENQTNSQVKNFEIFNLFGVRINSSEYKILESYSNNYIRVDISKLISGIYFLRIGSNAYKFIKMD